MEKNFIAIILMLNLTEAFATNEESKSIAAKPQYYYCKFQKENGTTELAKNCTIIEGKQIITTCSGMTCITKKTITGVPRNHCNDGGGGSTTFGNSTGNVKIGENFFTSFFTNIKKYCENGFKVSDEDKVKMNIAYLNKYSISNWKILELPTDKSTKPIMDLISNNECFLNAFRSLKFDYVKVNSGEKQWFNVNQNKYESLDEIYRTCEP